MFKLDNNTTTMGWSIRLYDASGIYMDDESWDLSNLTYNYSTPECMKYWYGPRDFDGKTVGEALNIMRTTIIAMFSDGILPLRSFDRETKDNTLRSLLFWLIYASIDLSKFTKEWTLKLI